MKIEKLLFTDASKIPLPLANKLKSLSFRQDGYMRDHLSVMRKKKLGRVSVIMDRDTNSVVSWATSWGDAQCDNGKELNVYTRAKCRNQGFGAMAVDNLGIKNIRFYACHRYGDKNRAFFTKVKRNKR